MHVRVSKLLFNIIAESFTWLRVCRVRKSCDTNTMVDVMSHLTMCVSAFFSAVFGVLVIGSTSANVHSQNPGL